MKKQHIHISVEDPNKGLERFVEASHKAEKGAIEVPEVHLNFEDFSMLMSLLTPRRLELLWRQDRAMTRNCRISRKPVR